MMPSAQRLSATPATSPALCRTARRLALLSLLVLTATLLFTSFASAQAPLHLSGHARDTAGRAVPSATVTADGPRGKVTTTSAADGSFTLDYPASFPASGASLTLRAVAPSLESDTITLSAPFSADIDLTLHPSAVTQQVTVTATRSSLDLPATANTVYALSAHELHAYPAIALDDQLRQQAGFELFRRSSSRVQNPT